MADKEIDDIKVPPHSVEAEQSVLGGLLLDNTAWDRVADFMSESDLYRPDHQIIYQHITRLIGANNPADAITVAESLEGTKQLEQVGGLSYLGALAQNTPSAANIRRYAEIVRERSILRKLASTATSIADVAYGGSWMQQVVISLADICIMDMNLRRRNQIPSYPSR